MHAQAIGHIRATDAEARWICERLNDCTCKRLDYQVLVQVFLVRFRWLGLSMCCPHYLNLGALILKKSAANKRR